MRKIMIIVLIGVLVAGIGLTLTNGIALGNIQVSSIQQLKTKNQNLEEGMRNLKQLKEVAFPDTMEELIKTAENLKSKRKEYASLISSSTENQVDQMVTAEKYEVEYLWIKLGNYATKNGVTLKLNILNGTTGLDGSYDLQFILNGKYAGITEFIYQVENDTTLGFRIDNFSLKPSEIIPNQNNTNNNTNQTQNNQTQNNQIQNNQKVDTEILTATFNVKDVKIDIPQDQLTSNEQPTEESAEQQNNNTVTNNTTQS